MTFRRILVLLFGMTPGVAFGQQLQSTARTLEAPREAFFENAPLAEAGFTESRFNSKEQRLGEHYRETPLGPVPQDAGPEAVVQPNETGVDAAEAGLGVAIRQNRAFSDAETNNATSNVCEPSIAARGQEILFTGNWFAAFSKNGGTTFSYRNPETAFPTIPGRPFCCDQVALYVPSHDLMVWFLQHSKDTNGNTVRLAVAKGADITNERWRFYDLTPQAVGNWTNEWFDYPDLAHSDQHLFISTNSFTIAGSFARSVCLRIPLTELANYAALNYRYFDRTDLGSLRPTQGSHGTMYVGTHASTASLRVFAWSDASADIQSKTLNVQSWVRGGAAAACPDGRDWLGFVDGRITSAWMSGTSQGFAWTSAQGGTFPFPHVRVAIVNYDSGTVSSQPHIWNSGFAFAYPGAAANSSGQIGICLSYGGNTLFPNPAVGVMNGTSWALSGTATSTHGPDRNRWGDYQTVRINGQNANRFVAAEFSLSGGPARTDIVPRLVQFDAIATLDPEGSSSESGTPTLALQPRVTTTSNESESSLESALVQTGLKFSAELYKKNQASHQKVRSVLRTLDGLNESALNNSTMIPLNNVQDFDTYIENLRLPDVGEFFFESPESVCDPDERQQVLDTTVSPWNGNCQLIITLAGGQRARGTGWFLTPTLVVTAGHCVHEGAGGSYFPQIEVIPGMNGPVRPFGSQTVSSSELRTSTGWSTSGSVLDDYGMIRLATPFAGVAVTPAVSLTDSELSAATLTLSGYPADKPTGTQWSHFGIASSVQSRRIAYLIDTYGGHSGSAVTTTTPAGRVVVGIHNYGGCPNKCTRITSDVLADLNTWAGGN